MPYSVTQRVRSIKQPYGGYLPIRSFSSKFYEDGRKLNSQENVHGSFVGLAVDYLTRFELTGNAASSFYVPMIGADICWQVFGRRDHYNFCNKLLKATQRERLRFCLRAGGAVQSFAMISNLATSQHLKIVQRQSKLTSMSVFQMGIQMHISVAVLMSRNQQIFTFRLLLNFVFQQLRCRRFLLDTANENFCERSGGGIFVEPVRRIRLLVHVDKLNSLYKSPTD